MDRMNGMGIKSRMCETRENTRIICGLQSTDFSAKSCSLRVILFFELLKSVRVHNVKGCVSHTGTLCRFTKKARQSEKSCFLTKKRSVGCSSEKEKWGKEEKI